MSPKHFAVFYKIDTGTVCRVSHTDTEEQFSQLSAAADERMLKVSYANAPNWRNMVRGLGLVDT